MVTEFELGWITAAIEAEGCFGVFRNNFVSRGEQKVNYFPQVKFTNSDRLFIERFQGIATKIICKMRPIQGDRNYTKPNHKRVFSIIIGNYSDIVAFCDAVIPHLAGKQKQAVLVRELASLCIGSKGKGIPCDLRKSFYDQVHQLNSGHLRVSQTTNTPDLALEAEAMKIESELHSNVQRALAVTHTPRLLDAARSESIQ